MNNKKFTLPEPGIFLLWRGKMVLALPHCLKGKIAVYLNIKKRFFRRKK